MGMVTARVKSGHTFYFGAPVGQRYREGQVYEFPDDFARPQHLEAIEGKFLREGKKEFVGITQIAPAVRTDAGMAMKPEAVEARAKVRGAKKS